MNKNYHEYSMKLEEKYGEELLEKYGWLLLLLNDIKKLTPLTINDTITEWKLKYAGEIKEYTHDLMQKLDTQSNKIIYNPIIIEQNDQVNELTNHNYQLLDVTTEYIRQKYTELGLLEERPMHTEEMGDALLATIVNQVEDKLNIYSTMAVTSSLEFFITDNALKAGWTEGKWQTQLDNRVRPSHVAMQGKWLRLDDYEPQPAGYQPGIDYNCRCYWIAFRRPNGKGGWFYAHK